MNLEILHKHLTELMVAGFGAAVLSLQQAAWVATIAAGSVSALCGVIKIYDWCRGRGQA